MQKILKVLTVCCLTSGTVFGAAYKIPEQSQRSMGTAGAYFAGSDYADANYYNPSNMVWLENTTFVEFGARYINLPPIKFKGKAADPVTNTFRNADGKTKEEHFVIPYFHFVFEGSEKIRWGVSFVTPAGLSKRWSNKIQAATAEEFTLKVFEFNPSVAFKVSDKFSIAGGLRAVYASGKIKYKYDPAYSVNMDGDTGYKFGYNLSATVRFSPKFNISTSYRSKVNLKVEGDASGYLFDPYKPATYPVAVGGHVIVPIPAEWRVGTAYRFGSSILEVTYEKTFWSSYKVLDIQFNNSMIDSQLGKPKDKYWRDSETVRVGLRHKFGSSFEGMLGIAYDETPIPQRTLGFELPDSNAWIFSIGGIYTVKNNIEIGFSYLYVTKIERNVHTPPNINGIDGKFSDLSAHLANFSIGYKF
ncbi:OmpP1/FadL family transporter [Persephonella sp.]